jgi:hypothetical protein
MQKQPIWLLAHAKTIDIMQNSESCVETKINTRFSNPLIKKSNGQTNLHPEFDLTSAIIYKEKTSNAHFASETAHITKINTTGSKLK